MTRVPRPAEQFIRSAGLLAQGSGPLLGPAAPAVAMLHPFLHQGPPDLAEIIEQARASALAKTDEIMNLRAEISVRSSELMAACARQASARFAAGGRLLTFGNGGSATDAQQLATLFLCPGGAYRPLPAICLAGDVAVLTALSNDVGPDVIFARQVAAFARPHDIVVGLSTSGNSENLLRAFDEAKQRGLMTIGLAGYDGGKMAELNSLDYLFVASSSSAHRIQEAQTTIYQILWELIAAEPGATL
jgi:D-sedoheptulose 7-phosphate isomerase